MNDEEIYAVVRTRQLFADEWFWTVHHREGEVETFIAGGWEETPKKAREAATERANELGRALGRI